MFSTDEEGDDDDDDEGEDDEEDEEGEGETTVDSFSSNLKQFVFGIVMLFCQDNSFHFISQLYLPSGFH